MNFQQVMHTTISTLGQLWVRPAILLTAALVSFNCAASVACADDADFAQLGNEYRDQTLVLSKRFCLDCHSTESQEGELDLERFATLADVRRSPRVWQRVAEMLDNGEMPPKDAAQPTPEERKQLRGWVERYLNAEAHASAGDPGRVVMRRLNNAEYTNTVRDLTGVPLSPAHEFPVDGAAGEGFTNTGESLVMSPSLLTKYFDAAKEIAAHAMPVPDGIRFSNATNRGDWIDELLADIRGLYARYTDSEGKIPLEQYLEATIVERDAITSGTKSLDAVAAERKLSPKYLGELWRVLTAAAPAASADSAAADYPGSVLDTVRSRWKTAKVADVPGVIDAIRPWQKSLWRTNAVGHFKPWHVPVDPVVSSQDLRLRLAPAANVEEVAIYLSANDAGDGAQGDVVAWNEPRMEGGGRAPLALKNLRRYCEYLLSRRQEIMADTAKYLEAASVAKATASTVNVAELAAARQLDPLALAGWLDYLGIVPQGTVTIEDHFKDRIPTFAGYDFVKGWGSTDTPFLFANSSDQEVHIPGLMRPHRVAVHPAPSKQVMVGWLCPVAATVDITAHVTRVHTACGNGITWSLELRRGSSRSRLAGGNSDQLKDPAAGPLAGIKVQPGDLLSLAVGPRDANHACDMTEVDLTIATTTGEPRKWQLSSDVSGDVLAGNPHADPFGNKDVWHFYTEKVSADVALAPVIPPASVLARWQEATDPAERQRLTADVSQLFNGPRPGAGDEPDKILYRQATSLNGPIIGTIATVSRAKAEELPAIATVGEPHWGIDPALFGKRTDGKPAAANSLIVQAPSVLTVRLPGELAEGNDFVVGVSLEPELGATGSVQPRLAQSAPDTLTALIAEMSIVTPEGSASRARISAMLSEVRRLFPPAASYPRIVPVDEAVTLQLLHRDDDPLCQLMLDDAQHAHLDRLWDQLRYVSQDPLKLRDAFDQLMEYATQDSDPKLFEPYRKPINDGAVAFRQRLLDTEPIQLAHVIDFATAAYRRPLTSDEIAELQALYKKLRSEELSHDDALHLVLARVFVSPAFLYRIEQAGAGLQSQPVNDWELASRLSYFLWASQPDQELRRRAAAGELTNPDILASEARRMCRDDRARNLAIEFACQWLEIRDFDKLDEKSESHFPAFAALRGDMYEESVRFFADLFQRDGSVLEILDADHTFLNGPLADFYGVPGISGPEFRRVDGIRQYGRGGILGLSTTLAFNSGASRTSPILRGNWLLEMVLGEKLPKPPKDVPLLPEDETATDGLTVRQLVEKHRSLGQCAVCHDKLDPFGFALEGFDAIGRRREKDLADRPIDTMTDLPDGTKIDGLSGLRNYLVTVRKEQFLRHFCKKLLGYALARGVQLSDQPLVDEMMVQLAGHDYRFSVAVETIVRSQQFRYHRGADVVEEQAVEEHTP